ncbi:MAG: hypothetical protein AAF497_15035, partial [Planctomycetota bacterium]
MSENTSQLMFDAEIAQNLRTNGQRALAYYFNMYQARLKASLESTERVNRRFEKSDILQNTFIEATRLLPEYVDNPRVPLYIWLRQISRRMLQRALRF